MGSDRPCTSSLATSSRLSVFTSERKKGRDLYGALLPPAREPQPGPRKRASVWPTGKDKMKQTTEDGPGPSFRSPWCGVVSGGFEAQLSSEAKFSAALYLAALSHPRLPEPQLRVQEAQILSPDPSPPHRIPAPRAPSTFLLPPPLTPPCTHCSASAMPTLGH